MEKHGGLSFLVSTFVSCLLSLALGTGNASGQSVKATEEWVAIYDGTASQRDDGVGAVVDAGGNVYVTGNSGADFATVKYDKTGAELWRARYSATSTSSDQPVALAVDDAGNVYVAGQSNAGSWDYLLIKYDASGAEQWVQTYDGAGGNDTLYDMAVVDVSGQTYIYVTGSSEANRSSSASADYATVKYDAAGTELWVARYDAGSTDAAQSLVVDGSGNAYVTGYTYQVAPESRRYYTTVKYDAAGTEQWVASYGGVAGSNNYAYDIGLDSSGNVVVTGSTATVQYNATTGAQQWATPGPIAYTLATDGAGNTFVTGTATRKLDATGAVAWSLPDPGRAIAVDAGGAVYVAWEPDGDTSVNIENRDLQTTKYDTDGTVLWSSLYDSGENHRESVNSVALYVDSGDGVTYLVVSGDSEGEFTLSDYATVKYEVMAGAEQWASRFDGVASSSSEANDLVVDASGNAYVTGFTYISDSFTAYATAKYGPDGAELWAKVHDFPPSSPGTKKAKGIVLDAAGSAYVTGTYYNAQLYGVCGTVKYDTDGVLQWAVTYDSGLNDDCFDIGSFLDSSDGQTYIYVAAASAKSGGRNDYALIKYDSAGVEQWVRTYSFVGADNYANTPTSLTVDDAGNAYLAGSSETVAGYLAANLIVFDKTGEQVWESGGYTITTSDSQFEALAVDALGNAYATGYAAYRYWIGSQQFTRWDLVTLKYDSVGNEVWAARYGAVELSEVGSAIAVDADGNVYAGGMGLSGVNNWDSDYLLVKYDADGVEQWVRTFDGGDQNSDHITAVAVDGTGTVYVTGTSYSSSSTITYTTIAYDSAGNQLWFERHHGGGVYGQHEPRALAVSDDGNVYVSGVSTGTTTQTDFGTVKYSQAPVTSDTVIPLVTAVSPADGAPRVTRYPTPVTATFSEAMDPAKLLDPAIFTVHDNVTGANLSAVASYDEATQTVQLTGINVPGLNFQYETTYTATLRAGATDLAGNPIAPMSWSFTIEPPPDTTPPTVASVSPGGGATGVITAPLISATFGEPMSPGFWGAFLLANDGTAQEVTPENVSYDESTWTAVFHLSAPLELNTSYTATLVGNFIVDLAGNRLGADQSWSFTTGSLGDTTPPGPPAVFPAPGATNVAASITELTATFDEDMAADVFHVPPDTEFTLVESATGTPVTGWPWYSGGSAAFLLAGPLTPGTGYTATILGTVTDISGNALGDDFVWSFTTAGTITPGEDSTAPLLVSVTPDGTSLVPPAVGLLTVTFNEAMDPATLPALFTVRVAGGAAVTGTVTYDAGARTARFVPDVDLAYDTAYQAIMGGGVTDLAGNPLGADHTWSFTTTPDPGALACDVDAGILEGCLNFDDFTYGTGVTVNTLAIGTTGPTTEGALRKHVVLGRAFSQDAFATTNIQSEASAYADATQFRLEARSRDIEVTAEKDGATAFAASKIDVTGVPPGTLIPMAVTLTRSALGDGYGVELQIHDFDHRSLGTIVVRRGYQQLTHMKNLYGDPNDPANWESLTGSDSGTMTFALRYPAIPNNGVVLYFASGAKKTDPATGPVESDATATVTFNPPPGVTVTLASGLTFIGEEDTDGDGVADSEDAEPFDASLATVAAATNTGLVEVALHPALGGGVTLSQVQNLDDSNVLVNQTNKPTDHFFPDGLTSFKVTGLAPGATATVTLTFPTPIPVGSSYFKVGPDGFYLFPPPDGPNGPGATIDYGTNTVTLTLVDGGAGDHDLVANGVIADPGGFGVPQPCVEEVWYDGINQSCKVGSDYDQDLDGYELGVDCDDENAAINPTAVDVCGDEIDQDCWAGDRACPSASEAHTCDYRPADWVVSLSELLRSIQLFNVGEFHCDVGGEDAYAPGAGDQTCGAHALDYNPQDWKIGLSELLRAIQFYNSGGYHPDAVGEDGFAPGL